MDFLTKKDIPLIYCTDQNDYHINDLFTFKKFIDTVEVPYKYILLSLDIDADISIFTNLLANSNLFN